ncbi:hypothetical protein F4802DRAFT_618100 [Xylaria palmicola]|nr:hypothetical protein F4802DRAFT_618100 [Xylaria palmicola]
MRATFYQRRRMPRFTIAARADGALSVIPPAGGEPADDEDSSDDELSDGEVSDDTSDEELPGDGSELSDDEFSDAEISDDEPEDEPEDDEKETGIPAPGNSAPSTTPLLPGTTALSSPSTTVAAPATTLSTVTQSTKNTVPATTALDTASLTATTSLPPKETASTIPSFDSSTIGSSQSISVTMTQSLPVSSSSALPSLTTPTSSSGAIPVLNPSDLTTSSFVFPSTTSDAQLGGPTDEAQADNNAAQPPDGIGSSASSTQKAGQIAGGTVGGIALVGFFLVAVWMWRRRKNRDSNNRLSGLPEDISRLPGEQQYDEAPHYSAAPPLLQLQQPAKTRSPSSIMNQLMTAAYAAEDGRDPGRRDSEQLFFGAGGYADEKQGGGLGFTAHPNESSERLTAPPAAVRQSRHQSRHQSIAARTETTERSESTWKTWGVLAGSSRPPAGPKNWWVDRYLRS